MVEVWCKLESVTGVMENFGIEGDFFVGIEVWGSIRNENVDASLLLFSMRGFVGGRGLAEESLAVFRGEFPLSLV